MALITKGTFFYQNQKLIITIGLPVGSFFGGFFIGGYTNEQLDTAHMTKNKYDLMGRADGCVAVLSKYSDIYHASASMDDCTDDSWQQANIYHNEMYLYLGMKESGLVKMCHWVALTAVAGFIVPATLLFLWRSRNLKPKEFQIRELARSGIPDECVHYEVEDPKIPRLSGTLLAITKWLSRTVLKYILGAQGIRQSKLDLLRSIDIPDCPTITPLPLTTWNPRQLENCRPVEFEKYYLKTRSSKKSNIFKFLSIAELIDAYRSLRITPCEVADNIIKYIKDSEERTPQMRIFTQYNPQEIQKLAEASTKRYQNDKPLSFLDGVPVGLKEEFDVIPYHMRNGTTFWSSRPCAFDASLVKKLRDGGAMIIGMTNMHEIGIGVTGNNANRLHGTPRNPYNVNHYTGGSSSGSAAAVATGLCLVALGTDGGGSIRMPAAACGVVGVKASYGRINTTGVVHTCHTVTHAGPICNSVNDAALVYAYLAGPDEGDPTSVTQPLVTLDGFDNTNLSGIRIGVDRQFFEHTDKEVLDKCNNALEYLKNNGAKIVELKIPELEETRVAHTITILVEMACGMMSKFDKYFHELNPDTVLPLGIGQQFTGVDYFQAQKQRTRAMVFLEKIFEEVDCIITPGLGMKVPEIAQDALKHGEANTMLMGKMMRFMALGNLTGIPGMTFPVGYDVDGLPISLQVMSGWWLEHVMLRVAKTCEGFVEHQRPEVYYDIRSKIQMRNK